MILADTIKVQKNKNRNICSEIGGQNMKKVKKVLALALVMVLSLSVFSCGGKAESGGDKNSTVTKIENDGKWENCTLTFSWWGGDSRHNATIEAIKAFEAKYPGIKVETTYGTWSGWEDSMATMFATKTAPDINQINWNWIDSYSSHGEAFFDLNQASEIIDLSQYQQSALDQCTVSDELQAIPVSMTGRIFYWNKTTFEKAGINVPVTLAELKQAGEIFKNKLGDEYYPLVLGEYDRMILMVYYLESVYGKPWVSEGKLQYSADEIKKGLEFIQSLEDAHVTPSIKKITGDGADSLDKNPNWINGVYAGIFEWDSSAKKFEGALSDGQEFVVGSYFTDMGKYKGGYAKVSLGFAISETCKHPKEAAMLLNFLLNEDEGTTIMASERGIPLSKAALENCKKKEILNKTVEEANSKVLNWVAFPLDPKFEAASLKSSDGVYYDAMAGLSYKEYTVDKAAEILIDGINEELGK